MAATRTETNGEQGGRTRTAGPRKPAWSLQGREMVEDLGVRGLGSIPLISTRKAEAARRVRAVFVFGRWSGEWLGNDWGAVLDARQRVADDLLLTALSRAGTATRAAGSARPQSSANAQRVNGIDFGRVITRASATSTLCIPTTGSVRLQLVIGT